MTIDCPAVLIERAAPDSCVADTVMVEFPVRQIVYGMVPGWYEISRTTDGGRRCVPFTRLVLRDGTLAFVATGPGEYRVNNWRGGTEWLRR